MRYVCGFLAIRAKAIGFSLFRIVFFWVLFTIISSYFYKANADDRRVIGEDILYTATMTSEHSEDDALFRAEVTAVRSLVVECGLPHRETKVWKKNVEETDDRWIATVQVGLAFTYCEEGKKAPFKYRKLLSNSRMLQDQALYDKMLQESYLSDSKEENEVTTLVKRGFEHLDQRLDQTDSKIEELKQEARKPAMVLEVPATRPSKAPASMCKVQADQLMSMAQTAALTNYPPGNMAQGQAAAYMSQAQAILSNCK